MQAPRNRGLESVRATSLQLLIILAGLLLTAALFLPGEPQLTSSGVPISEFRRWLDYPFDVRTVFAFCLRLAIYVQGLLFAAGALARLVRSMPVVRLMTLLNTVWAFAWWIPLVLLVLWYMGYCLKEGAGPAGVAATIMIAAICVPIYLVRAASLGVQGSLCVIWLGAWGAVVWFGLITPGSGVGVRVALLAGLLLVVGAFGEARRLNALGTLATLRGLMLGTLGMRPMRAAAPDPPDDPAVFPPSPCL